MTKKKILQGLIMVIILVISYGVYFFVSTKGIQKPQESITATELSQKVDPVGKFAEGELSGVTIVTSSEEFHKLNSLAKIQVTASEVIPTGVYVRKAWIGPYSASSSSTRFANRRKNPIPQETTKPLADIEFMHQYYLIGLEDGTYITAILEDGYVKKIKEEGTFVLPIGRQEGVTSKAKTMLSSIAKEHNVDPTPVLYMIDNEWYAENQRNIFMKAMLWGIGTFIVLLVSAAFLFGKVFED